MKRPSPGPIVRLNEITTVWSVVHDPSQFVLRYSPAIQRYLAALIPNCHDREEVAQDFFVRVVRHGFFRACHDRGRFRDYLKTAVRNAARNFLRRKQVENPGDSGLFESLADDAAQSAAEQEWVDQWRRCLLGRACRALARHERQSPGNLFYTVLRMSADHPEDDTATLAARTSERIGRPIQAAAFRKQVSRARRLLALLLLQEVAQTLDDPTPEQVQEELIEVGLWKYVRGYMPDDWNCDSSAE
jgi:RNA polymerase sigma factor (sigma-70 family)